MLNIKNVTIKTSDLHATLNKGYKNIIVLRVARNHNGADG